MIPPKSWDMIRFWGGLPHHHFLISGVRKGGSKFPGPNPWLLGAPVDLRGHCYRKIGWSSWEFLTGAFSVAWVVPYVLRRICLGLPKTSTSNWLVVWNIFYFPYIGNNHPNWLIFFKMVKTTNQSNWPPIFRSYLQVPGFSATGRNLLGRCDAKELWRTMRHRGMQLG